MDKQVAPKMSNTDDNGRNERNTRLGATARCNAAPKNRGAYPIHSAALARADHKRSFLAVPDQSTVFKAQKRLRMGVTDRNTSVLRGCTEERENRPQGLRVGCGSRGPWGSSRAGDAIR
jgi:hypothetical protein